MQEALGLGRAVEEAGGLAVGVREQALCWGVQEEALCWGVPEGQSGARAGQEGGAPGVPGAREAEEAAAEAEEGRPLRAARRGRRAGAPWGRVQWAGEPSAAGGAGVQEEAGRQWGDRLGVQEEHPPEEGEREEEERPWEGALPAEQPFGGPVGPGLLEEQGLGRGARQEQGLSLGGRQEQAGRAGARQEVGLGAQHQPQEEEGDVSPGAPREPWWGGQQAVQHSALQEGGVSRAVQEEGGRRRGVQEAQQELGGLGWGIQEGAGNEGRQQPQQG